ncbi:NAD(P)/FAD-dependent oxidoreductase [Shimia thalassica]|uniref:NAD(P)/FAD-dependent oxidoreductase n=1 Tax=Shimia thalassica TaxID=1715693 RepID=UPI0026E26F87|nr:FAD-dependent oxidoreductase [Shimia thalassica]MDO6800645.1 FAD-dependent oxidoreductase [Shimia thalassica]
MSIRIAIIGGGYIGAELAQDLEEKAEITLIEQRTHFVHTPAMIRAVVDPSILDDALVPYDKLLQRGRVKQARATKVDETGVTLENGERVEADYIVVATGSENAMPFKPNSGGIEQLRADNARIHGLLQATGRVTIVGAGAVGTELAGEIAHFMPEKEITLVSGTPTLFPDMPQKLGASLKAKLEAAGVNVILGSRAENLESLTAPYIGDLSLNNGQTVPAGLVFPAIGSRATSEILAALPGVSKGSANRIKVDSWMRPSALPNVFAAGDVAEMGDAMTIVATNRQIPWLKKSLLALVDGKKVEDLKPYTPWKKAPILVPLGPEKGNSFLSLFTAGDFLTRKIKGEGLFLQKTHKRFGVN